MESKLINPEIEEDLICIMQLYSITFYRELLWHTTSITCTNVLSVIFFSIFFIYYTTYRHAQFLCLLCDNLTQLGKASSLFIREMPPRGSFQKALCIPAGKKEVWMFSIVLHFSSDVLSLPVLQKKLWYFLLHCLVDQCH